MCLFVFYIFYGFYMVLHGFTMFYILDVSRGHRNTLPGPLGVLNSQLPFPAVVLLPWGCSS